MAVDLVKRNVWGTDIRMVDPDFCLHCERELPLHYDNCPLYKRNRRYNPSVDYGQKLKDQGVPITETPTGFRLG